jgi:hypothetical protein
VAELVSPQLVERARAVLHPWSGATPQETQRAREILRAAAKKENARRVLVSNEFRPAL